MDFCYKELMLIVLVVIVYFLVLLLFSRLTAGKSDNETFFRANRRSPWYMVAFGMVGASISGISFVSVPGMSLQSGMTYLQMCLGFIFGYFAIAFVLLPVYYRFASHYHLYLSARSAGSKVLQDGSLFLPSFQDDGCCRPFLCGLYHLAAICFRCLFHPVSSHGSGHGRTDLALHAQGWHQDVGLD